MKNRILVCAGTSGLSAGAGEVIEIFKSELKRLNLRGKFNLVKTGDRGLFRDVLVDIITDGKRVTYEHVKPADVKKITESHLVKNTPAAALTAGKSYEEFFANQTRVVLKNCGEIDPENIDEYIGTGGFEALKKAIPLPPEKIIDEIKKSGLRGRGGAGFSTGLKWEFCHKEKSGVKYMVCNADEGDPGAFMDRSILEGDPQSVIEGMIIAGYAIGANEGYIYCRAEYPLAIERLNKALKQAEERGFLGNNILKSDFSFKLSIKKGAGAFVCGEETALLASIEGKRGTPKPRPPFPAQKGLWGKPTVINNVETLANIPHIINNGADWFSAIGSAESKGTKVFALAGKVRNTGLVEIPMGTTIKNLIYGPGGGLKSKRSKLKAVQIGGPSGGCLPETLLSTPIDYKALAKTGAIMGSGGFIVMDEKTCMVDIAKFFLGFTVAESCGKCVPCRIGLKRMYEVLDKITKGRGETRDLDFLKEMCETIKSTALCGLGNTAPNPVLTTLKYFRREYEEHINNRVCDANTCVELVKFEVIEEKCVKCGKCSTSCPVGAIEWEKGRTAEINKEKCIKCMACFAACDFKAIK
ncbi:MAG: NADH-quinone oxidoreductase subunit NuoF [Elusimicrobia bacterium HGW-Elusimicrobia-2]|nr:MAG: NADH-quinone oxidoreductase subunit NuoF [Elusimicrobia bacterium HGW-Elusimicrobia-2]